MPGRLFESNLDAVLFDVDGTLVDSLGMIIRGLGDAYERFDGVRPPDEFIQSMIGMPLRMQLLISRTSPTTEDQLDSMVDFTLNRFDAYVDHESTFDAAVETLRLFHRAGIKTALVTSKDHKELESFLNRFSARDCVDATVCASDVSSPKPDPESARRACELLGVKPENAIMVGDSIYDLRCARGANVSAAAVMYGAGMRPDLLAEAPDLVFDTPEDLFTWASAILTDQQCLERK